jgi:hypothetical protein
MTGFRVFGMRWFLAIWILLLSGLSGGCGRRVVYVNDERKLISLKTGEMAPRDGVLVSPGYLSEMYEAMGRTGQK